MDGLARRPSGPVRRQTICRHDARPASPVEVPTEKEMVVAMKRNRFKHIDFLFCLVSCCICHEKKTHNGRMRSTWPRGYPRGSPKFSRDVAATRYSFKPKNPLQNPHPQPRLELVEKSMHPEISKGEKERDKRDDPWESLWLAGRLQLVCVRAWLAKAGAVHACARTQVDSCPSGRTRWRTSGNQRIHLFFF